MLFLKADIRGRHLITGDFLNSGEGDTPSWVKASALGFHTRADTRYKSPHRHERPADGKPGPYGFG